MLASFHDDTSLKASTEVIGEFKWQGHRLIVAHRPDFVAEMGARGDKHIAKLEQEAARWADKLYGLDGGSSTRAASSPTAVPRRVFIRQSAKRRSHRSSGLI